MKGGDLARAKSSGARRSRSAPRADPGELRQRPATRLGLYRRLSTLEKRADIDGFAAELVDRFGELPDEVKHLLDVVEIKGLARLAGLQQVDAGPKGAVIAFRKNQFANPAGLVQFMQKSGSG